MANNYANLLVSSLLFKQQSPVHDVRAAMVFYIWYSFCKLFSLISSKYKNTKILTIGTLGFLGLTCLETIWMI